MNNPYATPSAALADQSDDSVYTPRVFATTGRIGRLRYLAYSFITALVLPMLGGAVARILSAITNPGSEGPASPFLIMFVIMIYIPVIAGSVIMARRRLHDLNQSGWLVLGLLIPFLNILFGLYLVFWPGTKGHNKFGPPPKKNSLLVIFFALILPFSIGALAAISIPAYQDYLTRAKAAAAAHEQPAP